MADKTREESSIETQEKLLIESKKRTKLSATNSYMNAERTLSVWVRTSIGAMSFGIAIDRFGLLSNGVSKHPDTLFGHPSTPTTIIGAVLVIFSVIMACVEGWIFIRYKNIYRQKFNLPYRFKVWLPEVYAFSIALFGAGLFILMWWFV